MPKLTYTSAGFNTAKYHKCTSENTVTVYWSNLVWAAITAGKAGASEINQHKEYSRHERLMRLHLIRMSWKESTKGEFQQTDLYKALDGSEKTAISYFMGLTMAKYLSGYCLTVPWLLHYDGYLKSHGQKLKGVRPDLIGMNPQNEWFVLEAKGRSKGIETGLMENALEQACRAQPINIKDYTPIACIAYTKGAGILQATWEDPEGESDESGYTIDPLDFLEQYYAPIRSLVDIDELGSEPREYTIPGSTISFSFTTRSFPELDLTIGLLDEPEKFYLENPKWHTPFVRIPTLNGIEEELEGIDSNPSLNNTKPDPKIFVGPDGVFIELGNSWDSDNMQKEPNQRIIG